ncbi:MAG: hypothetical protein S4CHLAM102_11990 [Chlamydiia bacterium]|nr:hypothetical protein [Chlamydiia bacterium]
MQILFAFLSLVGAMIPQEALQREVEAIYTGSDQGVYLIVLDDESCWASFEDWLVVGDQVEIDNPYEHLDRGSPESDEKNIGRRMGDALAHNLIFVGWNRGPERWVSDAKIVKLIELTEDALDSFVEGIYSQEELEKITEYFQIQVVICHDGGVFFCEDPADWDPRGLVKALQCQNGAIVLLCPAESKYMACELYFGELVRELPIFLEGPCRPLQLDDQIYYPVSTCALAVPYPSTPNEKSTLIRLIFEEEVDPEYLIYITEENTCIPMCTIESGHLEYDPLTIE